MPRPQLYVMATGVLAGLVFVAGAAQTFFYNEVVKDGRIYVFATPSRYDAFTFGTWEILPKKANLFLRVDKVSGNLGDVETGLPGAEGIDYLLLSSHSPFTTWIFGGEWYFHPSVRVGPNIELIRYAHDPDPVNLPGRNRDSIFRVTFFWTF